MDNDLSAYSGKARPEYERLLEDMRSGRIDAVVAWHPGRLHRSPRELEDFVDVVEKAGATVETVAAGAVDLSTPSGRMVARMLGAASRYESEHKAERVRRKHMELAERGIPTKGGHRPFGLLTCGKCGKPLRGRPRNDGTRRYGCMTGPMFGGCGKIIILAEPLEDLVSEMALEAIDSPALAQAMTRQAEATDTRDVLADLRADEDALQQLARDHYVDRIIGRGEYLAGGRL